MSFLDPAPLQIQKTKSIVCAQNAHGVVGADDHRLLYGQDVPFDSIKLLFDYSLRFFIDRLLRVI